VNQDEKDVREDTVNKDRRLSSFQAQSSAHQSSAPLIERIGSDMLAPRFPWAQDLMAHNCETAGVIRNLDRVAAIANNRFQQIANPSKSRGDSGLWISESITADAVFASPGGLRLPIESLSAARRDARPDLPGTAKSTNRPVRRALN
jgi:hypothetical protein